MGVTTHRVINCVTEHLKQDDIFRGSRSDIIHGSSA